MTTKSVVMVDASVDEWKRKFVSVITPAAALVRCDFILFLL